MMSAKCAIKGCRSTEGDRGIEFFNFPKHTIILKKWFEICEAQPTDLDLTSAMLCSKHFEDDAFFVKTNKNTGNKLNWDALPTIHLTTSSQSVEEGRESPREEQDEDVVFINSELENVEVDPSQINYHIKSNNDLAKLLEETAELKRENEKLHQSIFELEDAVKLKEQELNVIDVGIRTTKNLISKIKVFNPQKSGKSLLTRIFSKAQISILLGKQKAVWTDDDMAVAYTILQLSNAQFYLHFTKKLNIPLPAMSGVRKWVSGRNVAKATNSEEKSGDE